MPIRILVAALFGLMFVAPASAQTPARHPLGIKAREHRQAVRIRDGVREGQITRAEGARLRKAEMKLRAEERAFRRSGNRLDRAEIRKLRRDLNRINRAIVRARHNGRLRG
jgi:hypothetical protein